MSEPKPLIRCSYVVARYVHDAVRDEAVNLGIILQAPDSNYVRARFAPSRGRLPSAAAKADQAIVAATLGELQERFANIAEHHGVSKQRLIENARPEELGEKFLASLSERGAGGRLRFSEPRAVLASDLESEAEHLFALYVGDRTSEATVARGTRLKTNLKTFFRTAGLLAAPSMKEHGLTADAEVTSSHSGVKHLVDFAYVNGKVVVVETADLTRATRECERQTYEAAAKLSDLQKSWKKRFEAFSVVTLPKGGDREVLPLRKLLGACSTVVSFSDSRQKGKLRTELEQALGRRSLVS
jgi:hypothetical protein